MIKWSILAFYWRIWKVSTLKIPILLVSAIVVAWLVASVSPITNSDPNSSLIPPDFRDNLPM